MQSRYYDPETGRFINADTIDYLDPESINGLNLYAYCNNNPVMYCDPTGHSVLLIGALIVGAIALGTSAVSQGLTYGWDNISWLQVGLDTAFAVGSVLLAATGIPLWGSIAVGAAMGFTQYGYSSGLHNEEFVWWQAAIATGLGAIGGLVSNRGARHMKSLSPRAAAGKAALKTTVARYGPKSAQLVKVNNLYGAAIQASIRKSITWASVKIGSCVFANAIALGLIGYYS